VSTEQVRTLAGVYADSVTLMQVSARARALDGVQDALVAMATELNLGLLAELGFSPPEPAGPGGEPGPNDLLVAVRATDGRSLSAAWQVIDAALAERPGAGAGPAHDEPPRTVRSAVRRNGPGLVLISVPGQHAFAEAVDALEAGCDVMIFSDNVPVEQEVALKDMAAGRGLLVLGPDCGTAIVGGIGLGFSHTVPAGPVGLVAASGTGAQQLVCLLDAAGTGVSAVLGVGGRDLSAQVGGRSARAALAALDEDPATSLIVLLSKPPAPQVASELREYAAGLATPVQFAMLGPGQPDLTQAAEAALLAVGRPVPAWPSWAGDQPATGGSHGALRGLFAGGTLCDEAMLIATERLGPVYSNIPLRPDWHIDPRQLTAARPAGTSAPHIMIDFGDDELTAGRPHPMIDQMLRLDGLAAQAADEATAVIMLDVVLGHGAHPDPAAALAPAIAAAIGARARAGSHGHGLDVVVSLIGASGDPQDTRRQAGALAQAGARVFASNAQAARFACDLVTGGAGQPGAGARR
jgi:FdrA protein